MIDNKTKIVISGEDRTKAAFSSVNRQMGALKNNAAALASTFRAVTGGITTTLILRKFIKETVDSQNEQAQLAAVIKSTGAAAGFTAEQLNKMATELAGRSVFSDGDIIKAQTRLLSYTGIVGEQVPKAMQAVIDMSARMGMTLEQSAETIGRALDIPSQGLTALQRQGFRFTDAQKKVVEELENTGRVAEAQKIILDSLQLSYGGAALAARDTFGGALKALGNEFDSLMTGSDNLAKRLTGVTLSLTESAKRVRELLDEGRGIPALIRAYAGLGKAPFDLLLPDIKPASTAQERIKEMRKEMTELEGVKARAKGSILDRIFGTPASLDQKITVLKNQIEAVEKFGDRIFRSKDEPAAAVGAEVDLLAEGTDAAAAAAGKAAAAAAARERKAAAAAALALRAEQSTQAARLEQDDLARQIDINKQAFDGKLIDATDYYTALTELQRQQADSEIALLQSQRAAAEAISGGEAERLKAQADIVKIATEIELVERRTASQAVANAASRQAVAAALKLQQDDFLEGVEQEAFLSSLSNDERETALLLLEAEKLGIADVNRLLELQGQIRQAAKDRQAAEELQRQQDDLYKSVQEGVQRAFADGLNAVASGAGGIRAALLNIVDTIRKALSNAIAGSLTESFLGMLGGKEGVLNIAGSLGLGGKKDGSTPASAIFVRDVAAGGALPGGAGEGGGMFAGFFDGIKSFFSSIAGGLSNLFSGLSRSLSGLFSGGGGGGGGGLFSAIAGAFGFADGGFTGPGGKYQPAGVVHAGEYVFSADSVRRLGLGALDNLHRIASGSMIPRAPRWGYAEGGLVNLPGSGAPNVTSNTKVVNMFDLDSALAEYLNTRGGERAILNVIQRNPGAASA